MSLLQIVLLTIYAIFMVIGQIMFKIVAGRIDFGTSGALLRLALDPLFILAVGFYAGLSITWVWLLTFTPLSRAYLFVGLAFVLTPAVSAIVFDEPITWRLAVGATLVATGILLVASR